MKTITLKCACGKTKVITGKTIDDVLDNIDAIGWQDYPDKKGFNGNCPGCLKKEKEKP